MLCLKMNNEDKQRVLSLNKNDFIIQVFRCGGKGGQKQNKTSSGVRIIHKDSGAIGESRDNRQQKVNKRQAFSRLVDSKKFKSWLNIEISRITTNVDKKVEEQMSSDNILVETINEKGQWEKSMTL